MTKRRDIIRRIVEAAKKRGMSFALTHEGGRHSIYKLDGLTIPIPRHREIGEGVTEAIYKQCEPKLGKGWWRK
ncbi:type II toxin-antitoxin system HicA family toxin [Sediminivirga luteola]|uniref:type II toxin-antitoxin system HicA family toxin n=1 Tax=Sediminivirga luteola TaxID=1774748 RepID=UPI001F58865D|nr:hypothetical protein [Sediminivirga luteola]MCI2264551.1 hypothetical protein [Sediminivirga luteola]